MDVAHLCRKSDCLDFVLIVDKGTNSPGCNFVDLLNKLARRGFFVYEESLSNGKYRNVEKVENDGASVYFSAPGAIIILKKYRKGMGCAHMIDFNGLNNVTSVPPISRKTISPYTAAGKAEPAAASQGGASVADVVQISSDAAMKGRLGTFAASLSKAMDTVDPERIAMLRTQYTGDRCPVSSSDIARAVISRILVEGSPDE